MILESKHIYLGFELIVEFIIIIEVMPFNHQAINIFGNDLLFWIGPFDVICVQVRKVFFFVLNQTL